MTAAPVCLFLYNRPDHSKQTLEALSQNNLAKESEIFIFIDGPKDLDFSIQGEIEALAKSYSPFFKNIHIQLSKVNLGLAKSVSTGVTQVVNEYGKVIVLEDDLVTSPLFLEFMNKGLEVFNKAANVYSINGYMHPIDFGERNEIFLSSLATSSWGWATWKNKWKVFDMLAPQQKVLESSKIMSQKFNIGDLDYVRMLNNETSWAIKWYYNVFIRGGLGVFPTRSFVQNIGFDGSGVNCNDAGVIIKSAPFEVHQLPEMSYTEVKNLDYEGKIWQYFSKNKDYERNFKKDIKKIIKKVIRKFS